MYQIDPMQIIAMIRNGQNPQQLMLSFLEGNMRGTPMGDNLIQLAKENKTDEIEKIARNIYAQRGLDFDKEFMAFKNQMGLK